MFKKGDKRINYNGRPKGSKNKIGILAKEWILKAFYDRIQELDDLEFKELFKGVVSLTPKENKLEIDTDLLINVVKHDALPDKTNIIDVDKTNDTDSVSLDNGNT